MLTITISLDNESLSLEQAKNLVGISQIEDYIYKAVVAHLYNQPIVFKWYTPQGQISIIVKECLK